MSEQDVRGRFLAVFKQEWALHLAQEKEAGRSTRGKSTVKDAPFETDVRSGEVRVFADSERPLAGLVLKDGDENGWIVVPVSEFSVPATEQEILVGRRTYQLWNARTVSAETASRSWLAETLAEADRKTVERALGCVLTGDALPDDLLSCTGLPVTAADDSRLAYETEYRLTLGEQKADVGKIARQMKSNGRWLEGGLVAATLLVAAGLVVMFLGKSVLTQCEVAVSSIARPAAQARCAARAQVWAEKGALQPACASQACEARARNEHGGAIERGHESMNLVCSAPSFRHEENTDSAIGYERYAEFKENEFVEVTRVPLSTFGLDVDTASYVTMRRYLTEERRLPPSSSVRLEEYVNYFHYDYPDPKGDCPIAVHCEMGACPWAKGHKLLRVGLQAKRIAREKMPPANLVFLLDCSGSMSFNNGFETLVKSMKLLTEQLRDEDYVSIVTYASDTRVALEPTSGSRKRRILDVLDSLSAGGGTYGAGGIQLAYEQVMRHFDRDANNRVILMTDGDFNIGISDPQDLEKFIEKKRESGVFLTVLGVGRGNYQDRTMKRLSTAGNGNYASIDGLLEAKKVLMTELCGSLYTVAKDVKLQLEFNPAQTSAYRLLGYETRKLAAKDFNDDRKDAGEMGAGHSMTALYELIPVGGESGVAKTDPLKYQKSTPVANDELLTVKLRYKEPKGFSSKLVETPVKAAEIDSKDEPSVDFTFASAVAEFALVLEKSEFRGEASVENAIRRARKGKGADENGYRAEFIRLAETVELIR